MGNAKPTIDQILTSLNYELLCGKAYLLIGKGLAGADPVVLKTSRTFFRLTLEACLQMSQMFAAKLYDKAGRAVTVRSLLDVAKSNPGTFKHGTPLEVSQAVMDAQTRVTALVPILKSVQKRRNEALAHLDPKTVANPGALDINAKLTLADLEKVFAQTGVILTEFSRLWQDATFLTRFLHDDDFTTALDLIADAKHAQMDKWESEFKEPCPFPRPLKPKTTW